MRRIARWIRWKLADTDCECNRIRLLCNCSWFPHNTLEVFSSFFNARRCKHIDYERDIYIYIYIYMYIYIYIKCGFMSIMYLIACFDFSQDFIKNWNYVWINTYDARIVVALFVSSGNYKQTQIHFSRWCIR